MGFQIEKGQEPNESGTYIVWIWSRSLGIRLIPRSAFWHRATGTWFLGKGRTLLLDDGDTVTNYCGPFPDEVV